MNQTPSPPRRDARVVLRRLSFLLLPLIVLGLLEFVLRISGVGYDTAYLQRVEVEGRAHLRDNPDFYTLFFPEHLRPRQLPFTVAAEKSAGTIRIALLGGSAAMGAPEPAFGMAPILEEQLAARHPGVEVEVLNLANTAVNSHVVRRVVASLAPLDLDAVVVVLGNNEVVGPFGAGTVFTARAPSAAKIRFTLWSRSTRVGQLLGGLFGGGGSDAPAHWRGAEMFTKQTVAFDDPALERGRAHFEDNLVAIAEAGEELDVPVVFTTLAANFRNCGPFASTRPDALTEEAKSRFDSALRTGDGLWERGAADSARVYYEEALAVHPTHADAHYRLGRLVLAAGDTVAAVAHLRDAREYDALRLRADAAINGALRRVSLRYDHVLLAELEAALASLSPAGLMGRDLFLDHVHLDFTGNRIAARVLADALELALLDAMGAPVSAEWLGTNDIARLIAYTAYGRREVISSTLSMLQRPPFVTQSDHLEQMNSLSRQLGGLVGTDEPEQLAQMWSMVEASFTARPDEWIRRFRAARFLADGMGDHGRAEPLWRSVAEEQPHFPAALNGWARSVAAQGRIPQAVRMFERSLELDPYQPDVRVRLAHSLRSLGPEDPQTRTRAFELEEEALLLEDSAASRARLRELYTTDAQWWSERGELARERILRTKLRGLPAD